jgi:AcrR family transcriptional regulator
MRSGAKPASQERSRQTRDRLLAALDGLLQEKGFDAITVAEIAARGGVSPASVYQRFNNRDAAIAILIELYMQRVAEWSRSPRNLIDYRRAGSLREAFEMVALGAWRQIDELGYLMRPAYLHSRLRPDLVGEHWDVQLQQAVRGFQALLAAFHGQLGGRDPAEAGGVLAYFVNMMVLGRLLHADERGAGAMTAEGFATVVADFACGYLAMGSAEGNRR